MKSVWIDPDRCTMCGLCTEVCVRRVLQDKDGTIAVTDPARCIFCGHCKAVCPEDAPQVPYLRAEEFVPAPSGGDIPDPDKLLAFMRSRRSVRIYKKTPVEREKIEKIIQAGRFAPTGGNRQHLEYVVINTPEKLAEIRDKSMEVLEAQADGIETAIIKHRDSGKTMPDSLLLASLYVDSWRELFRLHREGIDRLFYDAPALIISHFMPIGGTSEVVDAGLSSMQMVLMAEALGLGTCFCGFLVIAVENSPDLKEALQIPAGHVAPVSFMLGYPDVKYERLVSRRRARVTWL